MRYEKIDGRWEIGTFDEEETIEARIRKVIGLGRFQMEGSTFRFKPNLHYLDPMERERFVGQVWVDSFYLLPRKIVVKVDDTIPVWEISFREFNRKDKIRPPIRYSKRFILEPATQDLHEKIRKRLSVFDLDFRIDYRLGMIVLEILEPITVAEIKKLLAPGSIGVYTGRWQRNQFLKRRLIVDRSKVKKAEIEFDQLSRPLVVIELKSKIMVEGHIGLYRDSELIGTKYFDRETEIDKMKFFMSSDYRRAKEVVGICLTPPLPPFQIQEVSDK